MSSARHALLIGLAAVLTLLSGCVFKKKQPPVPQQGQAPPITAPETPPPAATEQPAPPEEKPAEAQPETKTEEKPATAEEAKTKPKKKPSVGKKPTPPAPSTQPPPAQASAAPAPAPAPSKPSRVIIQEGGAPASKGQLAAGVSLEDPSHNKESTEQLLKATQTNLNSINRPLSPDEQAMVAQIKDYMKQSESATTNSDPVRAHNLAVKAHLLSEELLKH